MAQKDYALVTVQTQVVDAEEDADAADNSFTKSSQPNTMNIDYDADPLHVEFNEDKWIPCFPCKFSLTAATILFAILSVLIGLCIALIGPQTETKIITETIVSYHNITFIQAQNENTTIKNIYDTQIINGQTIYFYTSSYNITNTTQVPVEKLNDDWKAIIQFPGKLWINALKLLVLPLIILMMIILPSRVNEVNSIGKKAIPLYLFTSSMAALQGSIWAWTVRPGDVESDANVSEINKDLADLTITEVILNVFYNGIPSNIVFAMSNLMILGCIIFFVGLGILLSSDVVPKDEANTVLRFCRAILRCCMKALIWVIWMTPIGMASLIILSIATTPNLLDLMQALGLYLLCVLCGHSIHLGLFYPILFWFTTRGNGWKWLFKIRQVPLFGFLINSSAATLPRSLQIAEKVGLRKEFYQFILPLGCAINMDGTALGFPIMIGLIAQLHGITLSIATIFVIMILSVIISVGTAPISHAGMVYMTVLFEAAGLAQYTTTGIATLFVVDWIVNRIEVAVNVTSDQMVTKIIDDINMMKNKEKNTKIMCGCCVCGYKKKK
eukprot:24792_1